MTILKRVHLGAGLIALTLALVLAGNAAAGDAMSNPWREAVLKGDLSTLHQLGTDGLNDADALGMTPLDYALILSPQLSDTGDNAAEIAAFLWEKNARCGHTVPDVPYGRALALTRAALGCGLTSLPDALAQYADAVNTSFPNTSTPLFWAAAFADANAIRALAQAGADVQRRLPADELGRASALPLHFAALYNPDPLVALALVKLGTPVDAVWQEKLSATPLMLAARHSAPVAKALLDAGANPAAYDGVSATPFYYAAGLPGTAALLRELVRKGADPLAALDGDDGSGGTAITIAAAHNPDVQVMRTLLELGLPVNEVAGYAHETPLMLAVRHNPNADIIRLLLASGAAPDLRDDNGNRADEGLPEERATWLRTRGIALPLVAPAPAPSMPTPLNPADLQRLPGKGTVAAGGQYVVASARYEDATGNNVIVLTEPPVTNTPDQYGNQIVSKKLYAQRFQDVDGQFSQRWRITDFVRECAASLTLEFIPNSLRITDLNNNGVKEIWVAYRLACRGDVSPRGMKIIMYEGSQKYAVRGTERIPAIGMGGEYALDNAFARGPREFRIYAEQMWHEYALAH